MSASKKAGVARAGERERLLRHASVEVTLLDANSGGGHHKEGDSRR